MKNIMKTTNSIMEKNININNMETTNNTNNTNNMETTNNMERKFNFIINTFAAYATVNGDETKVSIEGTEYSENNNEYRGEVKMLTPIDPYNGNIDINEIVVSTAKFINKNRSYITIGVNGKKIRELRDRRPSHTNPYILVWYQITGDNQITISDMPDFYNNNNNYTPIGFYEPTTKAKERREIYQSIISQFKICENILDPVTLMDIDPIKLTELCGFINTKNITDIKSAFGKPIYLICDRNDRPQCYTSLPIEGLICKEINLKQFVNIVQNKYKCINSSLINNLIEALSLQRYKASKWDSELVIVGNRCSLIYEDYNLLVQKVKEDKINQLLDAKYAAERRYYETIIQLNGNLSILIWELMKEKCHLIHSNQISNTLGYELFEKKEEVNDEIVL